MVWREHVRTSRAIPIEKPDGSTNFFRSKRYIENELFITVGFELYLLNGVYELLKIRLMEH